MTMVIHQNIHITLALCCLYLARWPLLILVTQLENCSHFQVWEEGALLPGRASSCPRAPIKQTADIINTRRTANWLSARKATSKQGFSKINMFWSWQTTCLPVAQCEKRKYTQDQEIQLPMTSLCIQERQATDQRNYEGCASHEPVHIQLRQGSMNV